MYQHINTEAYDRYAAAALQALIAKMPLMDRQGEFGDNVTDMEKVKEQLSRSAHEYAAYMIIHRNEFLESANNVLRENKKQNNKED